MSNYFNRTTAPVIADLDNAPSIARLYLETIGIRSARFRVVSARVVDLLQSVDVQIIFLPPVPDGFEPISTLFIDVKFWLWAESQIEPELIVA